MGDMYDHYTRCLYVIQEVESRATEAPQQRKDGEG